jgi:YD repeat-containing protein
MLFASTQAVAPLFHRVDRRLAGISNIGLSSGQSSTYGYTTTPENVISAITETSDSPAVYPSALTQTGSYNNLNQLTNLSGQALSFDTNGNLLSDGQRNYSWDAENRMVGISYPGQPGKQTAFTYDGLSRRTAITSTPAGGSATVTSYMWCGSSICQARNAGNTYTIRPSNSAPGGQAADFAPAGSNAPTLKLNFGTGG